MKFFVKYEVHPEQVDSFFQFHRLLDARHEVAERELIPVSGDRVALDVLVKANEAAPPVSTSLEVKYRHFQQTSANETEVTVYVGYMIRTATGHR